MKSIMKSLTQYITESKTEEMFLWSDENGDNFFAMTDDRDNLIEFEEKDIEKINKKYSVYDNQFIKAVFAMYPKADQLLIEYGRNNDVNKPAKCVERDEMDKGWHRF